MDILYKNNNKEIFAPLKDKWLVNKPEEEVRQKYTEENPKDARYVMFKHDEETENHLGLQFLLTGILSVYYDCSRTNIIRPGFTSFPSNRPHDRVLGIIQAKIPAKKIE